MTCTTKEADQRNDGTVMSGRIKTHGEVDYHSPRTIKLSRTATKSETQMTGGPIRSSGGGEEGNDSAIASQLKGMHSEKPALKLTKVTGPLALDETDTTLVAVQAPEEGHDADDSIARTEYLDRAGVWAGRVRGVDGTRLAVACAGAVGHIVLGEEGCAVEECECEGADEHRDAQPRDPGALEAVQRERVNSSVSADVLLSWRSATTHLVCEPYLGLYAYWADDLLGFGHALFWGQVHYGAVPALSGGGRRCIVSVPFEEGTGGGVLGGASAEYGL